ncbi:hypothetical protein SOASR030_01600 [Leminorella grimontii]|uniref:Uncharacterized protein n=1 Tax=Leminorella grimontii TaxID=82981 RepID=A0AAV5MXR1_9GAMM|nr:hypothetical protein [Leminorella grimontii]KFC95384.1 hypothetical protein GLGR_1925 [Leminorella grimontii ATCC 33999 = DSM 5078]GKX54048.1 hypothetical protein SOASR030_01600 [Leminorella grimontii]VFS60196.1 Uncharacterised protein [Leminorella grimontii]
MSENKTIEWLSEFLAYDNLYKGITPELAHQLAEDIFKEMAAGEVPGVVVTGD